MIIFLLLHCALEEGRTKEENKENKLNIILMRRSRISIVIAVLRGIHKENKLNIILMRRSRISIVIAVLRGIHKENKLNIILMRRSRIYCYRSIT